MNPACSPSPAGGFLTAGSSDCGNPVSSPSNLNYGGGGGGGKYNC